MIVKQNNDLSLRHLTEQDLPLLQELADNPKVAQNMTDRFPHPYTLEDAYQFYEMVQSMDPLSLFAIDYKGEYVGNVGLHPKYDVHRKMAEIGYFIGEPYWGQGIASQAVKLMVDWGFEHLPIHRIEAGVYSPNRASQRVLEKCGFQLEGILRKAIIKNDQILDEHKYAILKD